MRCKTGPVWSGQDGAANAVSLLWPDTSTSADPRFSWSGHCALIPNPRALAATLVPLTVAFFAPPSTALAQDGKLVSEWNQALFSVGLPGGPAASHPAAILHIAMFEAVNAIERAYTPFRFDIRASRGASTEAAAAQAAHDVLTALFPTHQTDFDTLLNSQLANLPAGREKQGIAIGQAVAKAVLEWRQNDGWPATIVPDPTYVLPLTPGNWQPTPPAFSFATFTFLPKATPFAIQSSTQFLPPPLRSTVNGMRQRSTKPNSWGQ